MAVMHNKSAFIAKSEFSDIKREIRYEMILFFALFITGTVMIMIPIVNLNGFLILTESWVLILSIALIAFRPFLFGRGIADISMTVIWVAFYFTLEFSFSFAFQSIENFKFVISFTLIVLGITRIIAFAQLINNVLFPLMIVEGICEVAAAVMVFSSWPAGNYGTIYLVVGMTIIISSTQHLQSALKLKVGK